MQARLPSALVVLLVACAGAAENNDPLRTAPPIELVEELRLDPNAEDFSVVMGVDVGPRGQLAVLLPQDLQVRLYDSSGASIATIGRRGSGPGEFQHLSRAGWLGDTMYVLDLRLRRAVMVAPDGSVIGTSVYRDNVAIGAAVDGDERSIGYFNARGFHPDGSMLGVANMGGPVGDRAFLLAPADISRPARLVAWHPPDFDDERWRMHVGIHARTVAFAPRPHVAVAPDATWLAFLATELTEEGSGTFTLTRIDASGDTTLVRSYPYRGVPIPASVRDSAADAFLEEKHRSHEGSPDRFDRFRELTLERMPPVYPPVIAMTLGLDGTTWLTMRDTADVRRVLVLDERGDPLGTFVLPPRATVRQGRRTHVWMTQRDDVDLVAVLRYWLEPAVRASTSSDP